MKEEARQTISVGDLIGFFSKYTLFLIFHIAQQTAAKPAMCIFLLLGMYIPTHSQN
jgi:hypothetical protein